MTYQVALSPRHDGANWAKAFGQSRHHKGIEEAVIRAVQSLYLLVFATSIHNTSGPSWDNRPGHFFSSYRQSRLTENLELGTTLRHGLADLYKGLSLPDIFAS